jgi:hypothetical protein
VSRESAERDYGVVVAGIGEALEVDEAATDARREHIRATRPAPTMFDRGSHFRALEEQR